ncbi:MAG: hypothetical protein WCA30_05270, partial [Dermatophilaceae bacterium]
RMTRRGMTGLAYYYGNGGMSHLARLIYEEVLRRDATGPVSRTVDLSNMSAAWMTEDVERAAEYGREAFRLVEELHLVSSLDVVTVNYANALFLSGDWDAAFEVASRGDTLDRPISAAARTFVPTAIAVARGETPPEVGWSASDVADSATWLRAYAATELAMRLPNPPPASAVADAVSAVREYFDQVGLSDDHAVIWSELLGLVRSIGDDGAVRELVDLITDDAVDRSVAVAFRGHRHRAMGLSAADLHDDERAVDHLRRAVEHYDAWRAVPLAARTRGELGSILIRSASSEERAEGADLVATAGKAFTVLRARAWREELDSALESVGSDRY